MSGLDAIMPAANPVASPLAVWNTAGSQTVMQPAAAAAPGGASFGDMISAGLSRMDERVASADALVRSFALGDDVPLHQVTFALEQARLSVEFSMQVQNRLIEGYRQLMNMQL